MKGSGLHADKPFQGDFASMSDESTKRAAQEYLASRIAEENQTLEGRLNAEAAVELAPLVWKRVNDSLIAKCKEWNAVTNEQTLTCKETILGDIRVWCTSTAQQMTVHYDSKQRLVTVKNSARADHEKDIVLRIEGYATETGREAQLVRNKEAINIDSLILGQLRVLTGLGRQSGS
jgi:hypothetical protein